MTKPHRSPIEWTDLSGGDANFIIGCTPVSEGCANCYAKTLVEGRMGRDFSQVRIYPEKLAGLLEHKFEPGDTPFRRGPGSRPMCFVVDLGDLFHPDVPDYIVIAALRTMAIRADVDWQVLTKRAIRAATLPIFHLYEGAYPDNVWLGFTAENQHRFDERADIFQDTPAAVRFVSLEPMLGPVRLGDAVEWLSWVIVGAESGNRRRPFDLDWARSVRDECAEAGVPFFYKQGSHRWPGREDVLDGETWKQFPREV